MSWASVPLDTPCAICGKSVGGELKYCPKCKGALCLLCGLDLIFLQKKWYRQPKCPMSDEYFPLPYKRSSSH